MSSRTTALTRISAPALGHYFRAMAGQDMAGIDIIGGQVIPGFSRGPFGNVSGAADGEFFHFGLAKLASSAAHLDPLKQGRAMCETIGASGWYAGLRLFTWLTNHLLVRGVTHVVPHAFSPAPFPDLDCPPHFFAHGQNPQYRYHHLLSDYTNRLSHLLQGGKHIAPFAVLYHADAEWLGDAMPCERPLRLLMEAQLDADIVPADSLESVATSGATLAVGAETYDALIVPGSAFLPAACGARASASRRCGRSRGLRGCRARGRGGRTPVYSGSGSGPFRNGDWSMLVRG